jgi:archaetidylinositol phosphate synthase
MVVLGLGQLAHAIDESESFDEVRELECALERVVDLCPAFWSHDLSIYDRLVTSVSSNDAPGADAVPESRRAGRELLLEGIFRPLSNLFVPLLQRAKVPPPAVVLANAATGLVAALALARGDLIAVAVLLQVKSLLDNIDGQLARASGRVTLAGRYLDTIADLVVNAAVFAALGYVMGQPVVAAAAFVALTLVLAFDYNVTALYREAHGIGSSQPKPTGSGAEHLLALVYCMLFAPLDRAVRSFATWRLSGDGSYDRFTVTALANLGLTTQFVVLGVCLVLGAPTVYLWFVVGCLAALVPLHLRAERQARAAVMP